MANLVEFCLFFGLYLTYPNEALSAAPADFSIAGDIGETISTTLNLTKLGWHTDDVVRSVLAWNNVSHPVAILKNGSMHSECYNDLSFLERSVRCSDFNISAVETNIVSIKIRVVTEAMAANYLYYPFYRDINHNTSFVHISVQLKDTPSPTSAASYVTPISSISTPTEPPTVANMKTKGPVTNQGLRLGISFSLIFVAFLVWLHHLPVREISTGQEAE